MFPPADTFIGPVGPVLTTLNCDTSVFAVEMLLVWGSLALGSLVLLLTVEWVGRKMSGLP